MNDENLNNDEVLKFIKPYISNKKILDIGCVEHDIVRKNKQRIWVHDFLITNSKDVLGIDILKKDVAILKKDGYNVLYANAETFNIERKFDVIFAGDLIEHLSNPGLFLDRCKKHLEKNGKLILVTPNAFSANRFLLIVKNFTSNPDVNSEHTVWFSLSTLQELLSRYNFKVKKVAYAHYPIIKPSFMQKIVKLFANILGDQFKETLMVVCEYETSR